MFLRLLSILALSFVLAACAEQPVPNVTPISSPLPTPPLLEQPTTQPLDRPPTITAAVAATQPPATVAQPTIEPATPIPAATATRAPAAKYVFPVKSDGKISYGKVHHDYPATDIFCPIGSLFVAVTSGVVDFVSREDTWDPSINDGSTRGGLSVAIIGDDGVRYYGSHLSQVADGIEPGVRVAAGQQLGLTGRSGDARVTDPHLHFGISHPTTPSDWAVRRGEISPYPYLQAWQRGKSMRPDLSK